MYDKEQIYDEKINPLMSQIIKICQENNIQVLVSFTIKGRGMDDKEDMEITIYLPSKEYNYDVIKDADRVKDKRRVREEKYG